MPRPAPPRQLESIASGAAYINVSTRTIRRWIASGQLRAYRVGPRLCKIDRADLERLVRRIPAAGWRRCGVTPTAGTMLVS